MGSKMLIDATHAEETRVVVVRGNRIEEFDFESAARRQLKGNIYLAKVTRVEPSLQAAFVEYGGNRHGFLAFSEIHPDYYQIPLADRQALLREQEEEDAQNDDDDNGHERGRDRDRDRGGDRNRNRSRRSAPQRSHNPDESVSEAVSAEDDRQGEASASDSDATEARGYNDQREHHDNDDHGDNGHDDHRDNDQDQQDDNHDDHGSDEQRQDDDEDRREAQAAAEDDQGSSNGDGDSEESDNGAPAPAVSHGMPAELGNGIEVVEEDPDNQSIESIGAEDALEEVPQRRRKPPRRQYKIQEVIKRRQVILVQVVKEERGNKGAALTTYLSLAGRYCVLMPNTARGGGISRKITDSGDRRRLKEVAKEIEVPQGMGLIVRTAGAQRTKTEIKRDYDYLLRMWESVRDLTLSSTAPALVYEEGSLIKRAIRDLYTKDVDEVIVEGDPAYREAKDFMKMLMPSHAKNVKLYKDSRPAFSRHQVESQLDGLYSPTVTLPSGGYMVINQTEALVSVDINSGKSTREHNIEDTALRTNLEASDEIARQLRLRDLAGLVVIDFIDMEEKRNNRNVERRLKDALKNDRARIQVGRISHFGLLEMSRQRLRPGLLEGSSRTCPHCEGRGIVRSISSCGLSVLRSIEEHLIARKPENLTVKCSRETAFYILNEKRDNLLSIETSYGISIFVVPSDDVKGSQAVIERAADRNIPPRRVQATPVRMDSVFAEEETEEVEETSAEDMGEDVPVEADEAADSGDDEAEDADSTSAARQDGGGKRKRRRRGRRGGRGREDNRTLPEGAESSIAGLGEQPDIAFDGNGDTGMEPAAGEPGEAETEEAAESVVSAEGEGAPPLRQRRERRDRWGRNRNRTERRPDTDESRSPEPQAEAATNMEQRTPAAAEVPAARPAPLAQAAAAALAEEPAPRKWQPPAATVAPASAERKSGWWSKR